MVACLSILHCFPSLLNRFSIHHCPHLLLNKKVLYRVALSLLLLNEHAILALHDMNDILMFLRNLPRHTLLPHTLLPQMAIIKFKVL